MRGYRSALPLLALVLLGACGTRPVRQDPATSVGPQLAVESFLRAANLRDLEAMGRLFGTSAGPMGETGGTVGCAFRKIGSWFGGQPCLRRADVELRLDAIASILSHQDYAVIRQERVAGREHPTARLLVDLRLQGRTVTAVPFLVVHAPDGRWLVQEVDLARVMAGGR